MGARPTADIADKAGEKDKHTEDEQVSDKGEREHVGVKVQRYKPFFHERNKGVCKPTEEQLEYPQRHNKGNEGAKTCEKVLFQELAFFLGRPFDRAGGYLRACFLFRLGCGFGRSFNSHFLF